MREPGRAPRPPLDPVITVLQRGRLSISRLPLLPNSETRCDSGVGGWPGSVSVSRLLVGLDIYCDEYTQIWVFLPRMQPLSLSLRPHDSPRGRTNHLLLVESYQNR